MAQIKNAVYQVTGETVERDTVYHFQTNTDSLTVLDKNGDVVGNLGDLQMRGLPLKNVSFRTIKIKGLYGITGIQGIESTLGVDVSKMNILSVTPFGEVNNPTFVIYKLITPEGKVFDNVIANGKEVGWTSGGKELESTLEKINTRIGAVESLETTTKTSTVSAINEVDKTSKATKTSLDTHLKDYTEYKKHNHDEDYIKQTNGTIKGIISIDNGVSFNAKDSRNTDRNLFKVDSTDLLTFGSTSFGLDILAKGDLKYNSKKVWTETNHGKDSGLDADKLGGVSYKDIPTLSGDNTFKKNVKSEGSLIGKTFEIGTKASITADSNGKITISTGSGNPVTFESNGRMTAMNHVLMNAKNNEVGFRLALSDKELGNGMGFYRNSNSEYLGIYNWTKGVRLGYFSHDDEALHLDKPIFIQGRRLWLQGSTPSGNHNTGDIWIK